MNIKQITKDVPRLIQDGKYDEATKLGAFQGASYLAADNASFLPEVHFFAGKKKLKLAGVITVRSKNENVAEVMQNAVIHTFKEKKPVAVLTIFPGFVVGKKNPYAFSMLFLKPKRIKSFAGIPVGTAQELKRAVAKPGKQKAAA